MTLQKVKEKGTGVKSIGARRSWVHKNILLSVQWDLLLTQHDFKKLKKKKKKKNDEEIFQKKAGKRMGTFISNRDVHVCIWRETIFDIACVFGNDLREILALKKSFKCHGWVLKNSGSWASVETPAWEYIACLMKILYIHDLDQTFLSSLFTQPFKVTD